MQDLKFDIGNMLNKAIAVIEEDNDAFYGVLPASYMGRPSGSAVIKPGNVWLTSDGTAKIGDLGLAVALDHSRLTTEGMMALNLSSKNSNSTAFRQATAYNCATAL